MVGFCVGILLNEEDKQGKDNKEDYQDAKVLEQELAESINKLWLINKEELQEIKILKELKITSDEFFKENDEISRITYVVLENQLLEGSNYTQSGFVFNKSTNSNNIRPSVKLLLVTSIFHASAAVFEQLLVSTFETLVFEFLQKNCTRIKRLCMYSPVFQTTRKTFILGLDVARDSESEFGYSGAVFYYELSS